MAAVTYGQLAAELSAATAKDVRRIISELRDLACGRAHISMFAAPRGESEAEALRREAFVAPPFMKPRQKARSVRVKCGPLSMFAIQRG